MKRRRVILESPYAGRSTDPHVYAKEVEKNVRYARACVRDSLLRGEAPIASHLLYTQPGILDDTNTEERTLGIESGLEWGDAAKATVVYIDHGISGGMKLGIANAVKNRRPYEMRNLGREVLATLELMPLGR